MTPLMNAADVNKTANLRNVCTVTKVYVIFSKSQAIEWTIEGQSNVRSCMFRLYLLSDNYHMNRKQMKMVYTDGNDGLTDIKLYTI